MEPKGKNKQTKPTTKCPNSKPPHINTACICTYLFSTHFRTYFSEISTRDSIFLKPDKSTIALLTQRSWEGKSIFQSLDFYAHLKELQQDHKKRCSVMNLFKTILDFSIWCRKGSFLGGAKYFHAYPPRYQQVKGKQNEKKKKERGIYILLKLTDLSYSMKETERMRGIGFWFYGEFLMQYLISINSTGYFWNSCIVEVICF